MLTRRHLRRSILFALLFVAIIFVIVLTLATFQVRATSDEIARALPGDSFISHPLGAVNHAITIHRPPREVWPWLVQMGAGRGGWYTYDFIDNRGCHSATRIIPAFQEIHVGSIFPALPGTRDVFAVAAVELERSLVLAWRQPDGTYQTTWASSWRSRSLALHASLFVAESRETTAHLACRSGSPSSWHARPTS